MIRIFLIAAILAMPLGCSKSDAPKAEPCKCDPAPVCPCPKVDPKPKDEPKPAPKCPRCPNCPDEANHKPVIQTKTAIGVVREASLTPTGAVSLLLEGEKLHRYVIKDAEIMIDGKAATAADVVLWFKGIKDEVKVKLTVDPVRFGAGIRAEFWTAKK